MTALLARVVIPHHSRETGPMLFRRSDKKKNPRSYVTLFRIRSVGSGGKNFAAIANNHALDLNLRRMGHARKVTPDVYKYMCIYMCVIA